MKYVANATTKTLLSSALVALMAACTTSQGDGQTDAAGSAPGTAAASGPGTADEPSPACAEAFGPLAGMGLESTSDLGELEDEVTVTIESCESVTDWIAGAQQVVENEIRPGAAELLLGIRCEGPGMSDVPICEEL